MSDCDEIDQDKRTELPQETANNDFSESTCPRVRIVLGCSPGFWDIF